MRKFLFKLIKPELMKLLKEMFPKGYGNWEKRQKK